MNILFVCKWNRFRSKAAEAIFNKLNKNKQYDSKSAGLFPGVPVTEDIIKAGKRLGIKISRKQKGITHKLLMWSNIIIVIDDNIPISLFKEVIENDNKKVFQWKFKDVIGRNINERERIILKIKEKIEKFLIEKNNPNL